MSSGVLVLNADYQAISVCSVRRAFKMVLLDKAETLESLEDHVLRTERKQFAGPSIIRLRRYISLPYKKVSLNRQNIYKRDGHRCVYCGSSTDLTIDHVQPRARGGGDSWENLVTACNRCNSNKGNRTPEEAGMRMRTPAYRPSFIMYLREFNGAIRETWMPYLSA